MNSLVSTGHKILSNRYAYSTYQFCVGGTSYRNRVLKAILEEHHPRGLTDLGCGPGPTLKVLPKETGFTGVDLSAEYLTLARKKRKNANLILENVINPKWLKKVPPEDFDLVLSMGLFHHLSDVEMLRMEVDIFSRLPAGTLIKSVDPTLLGNSTPIAQWFAKNDRGKFVRTPEKLASFFEAVKYDVKVEVQRNQFNVPLDTVELSIVKL